MAFSAKILADSLHPNGVKRLTTFEITFPRCILAEFNTHRMISRNAASSRAIPVEKLVEMVKDDPFIPEFRANQKGMQAGELLPENNAEAARVAWKLALDEALTNALTLSAIGVHKQYANRLLEPFMWVTVIATATEWANFFALRCAEDAEPSFQRIARMMLDLYRTSQPKQLQSGDWHLPMIDEDEARDWTEEMQLMVSVGRCARVSYLTHDGKRDPIADMDLHDRLMTSGHWSPFEHQAIATRADFISGNFHGFEQYRKMFQGENVTDLPGVER